MYRPDDGQLHIFDLTLEDTFKLDPENRWVKRAKLVPWDMAEAKYMHLFSKNGRPAKQIRMALGSLLIQEYLKCSDEETVQSIAEQPYLQYFVGLKKFTNQAPFDASLMVWFRKRLSRKFMAELNEAMCAAEAAPGEVEKPEDDDDESHGGTLIVDATCCPADITYPTDTGLLAEAVEKTDKMIDVLHEPNIGERPRPRTYREKSRKVFAQFVKQRKPSQKSIRACKRSLLGYLRRNLGVIHKMLENGGVLSEKQAEQLEVIHTLYEQQERMYKDKTHSVEERIVSISQPHIRPIVRGKAGKTVEFGAKVAISVVEGYVFVDEIEYDPFHEGNWLEFAILNYYKRFGCYPKEILADQIYRDRYNRKLCKELQIRLQGKPLGRPPKNKPYDYELEDVGRRNEVEGKIGTLKTRYGLGRIRAKLEDTSVTAIHMAVFAFNLNKRARALLFRFFRFWLDSSSVRGLVKI